MTRSTRDRGACADGAGVVPSQSDRGVMFSAALIIRMSVPCTAPPRNRVILLNQCLTGVMLTLEALRHRECGMIAAL